MKNVLISILSLISSLLLIAIGTAAAIIVAVMLIGIIAVICVAMLMFDACTKFGRDNRKTPQQVMKWLQAQEWFPRFEKNVKELNAEEAQRILSGKCEGDTVSEAFFWDDSEEGYDYWEARDNEFTEWYNKD